METWMGKPYYSLDVFLQEQFHEKVYKVSLDGGFTCPNRDGSLDTRGCIFCSAGGSGEFAGDRHLSISRQLDLQIEALQKKRPVRKFIAYFQAFTNTYAPADRLEALYREAMDHPGIAALSVATRPDCLPPPVLDLLARLNREKPVWVELGLQTANEDTAAYIRRGYPLSCFEDAVMRLQEKGLDTIVHTILGLPGESRERMLDTIRYINRLPVRGIKLQLLHVPDLRRIHRPPDPLSGGAAAGYCDPPAYRRRTEGAADRPPLEQGQAEGSQYSPSGNGSLPHLAGAPVRTIYGRKRQT